MKIISMATPTHERLEKEWFLPSFKDDAPINILHVPDQGVGGGMWRTKGFDAAVTLKVGHVVDTIAANPGELVLWADVDIQFFQPVVPLLEKMMEGKDMLFQRGHNRYDEVCTGFFVCRASWKTLLFWRAVHLMMRFFSHHGDQATTNTLLGMYLKRNRAPRKAFNLFGIVWDYLPDSFYCPGVNAARLWKPGVELLLPDTLHIHHANWTVGIPNKIAQFEYVRDKMDVKRKS